MSEYIPPIDFNQWKLLYPNIVHSNSTDAVVELYARYREVHAISQHFNIPRPRPRVSWWRRIFSVRNHDE